jgi:hypothetical protein
MVSTREHVRPSARRLSGGEICDCVLCHEAVDPGVYNGAADSAVADQRFKVIGLITPLTYRDFP